jgi:hypothetical protein
MKKLVLKDEFITIEMSKKNQIKTVEQLVKEVMKNLD